MASRRDDYVETALHSVPLADVEQIASTPARDREYVPRDGGYGWMCVFCVFLINSNTWGLDFAYGVFLDYFLTHNHYPGATALDYALIGGISISMSLVITPLINTSSRKLGTRPTLLIGLVALTASLVGASFATEVWHLFLSQGVCFGWGVGFLYIGSSNIIPQWFSSKRSLANGLSASGAGFGGLVYSLAASQMLETLGPAGTFRILAICGFVGNFIAIVLINDQNARQRPNHSAFNYRLLARIEVWLVLGWGCLSELGYTVLLFSLPNYASSIGLSARQGSIVIALLNLSLFVGRPLLGHSSDMLGRINMAVMTTGVCGTSCLLVWIFAKSFGVLCFFAILAGLVCGTFWATVAPVVAEVSGLSEVPSTLSIVLVLMVVPTTFAESIALGLRRPTGNIYLDAQIFVGFMFIAASICTLFLRSWKINKMKHEAIEQRDHQLERLGIVNRQSADTINLENRCSKQFVELIHGLFALARV
ncbi:MFS general substrate transporter [Mollisia scopiformis]|uniref:MFS general substrate transporter n=1 Tax=Mollisia scopiformis TaxID=149040 RepID=A0A132B2Y5_MOLSC|nr:MFS general substrate transporter [Mollisia scopiformis]KUJ06752.1 MFS general substrate transporter [Mollisia scopiformis]